ncbi:MAG: hypothetical protein WBN23_09020 [Woeseia sp.]
MKTFSQQCVPVSKWARAISCGCALLGFCTTAGAVGTPVGTVIQNTATVAFDLAGTPLTLQSNTTTITVVERIDVIVTRQSPHILVAPNDTGRAILFTVTNTGNGSEAFALSINSVLGGDDFDPLPAVPAIYFDTDGSGDFNAGDVAYNPGVNDPLLAADASQDIFVVNDIPGTVVNGESGLSQLSATAVTGAGAPGTEYAGQGDGGVDAVIGTTGGSDADTGEYLVSDVTISVVKAQLVSDPFGGSQPIPGATISYSISVEVTTTGTASGSVISDLIPIYTTYVPGSITLNALPLSDATDADAGEYVTAGQPTVVVRLGDLTQGDGTQTVVFQVTID